MLERVDCHLLMTFEYDQIMAVTLMVAEEEVLAMDGIYVLPVLKGQFDGWKRRMDMEFIIKGMLLQEAEHLVYSWIACHLLMLFA